VRSVRLVPCLSAAVVLLAACGGIPSTGPPMPAEPIDVEDQQHVVGSEAEPPVEGGDVDDIVAGFFEAMDSNEPGGTERRYGTAAQYLTQPAASSWQPLSQITVYDGAPDLTVDGSRVSVVLPVSARYDRANGYVRTAPGTEEEFEFVLEDVDGEWRISTPPDGLVVSGFGFDNGFQAHNLYFFDQFWDQLIPDPVYVPRGANVATLLVQTLLEGPSEWLEPAVTTAFPSGTTLDLPGVPVSSAGLADISLSAAAATNPDGSRTSPEARDRMAAQLAASLSHVAGLDHLVVTAGHEQLTAEEEISVFDPSDEDVPGARHTLFGIGETGVVWLDGDGSHPVDGPLGQPEFADAIDLAVDNHVDRAAVIDGGGTLVWADFEEGAAPTTAVDRGALASPAWDSNGLLWAIDRGSDPADAESEREGTEAGFVVHDPVSGEVRQVPVDGANGASAARLSIAPDGTRIASVVDGELRIGVIVHDPDDPLDVRVAGLRPIRFDSLTDPVADVAWHGQHELAILTELDADAEDGARQSAYLGSLTTLSAVIHRQLEGPADTLAAAIGGDGIAVGGEEYGLQILLESLRWAKAPDVHSPAYALR
jgi:hypothetical protein